MVAETLEDLLRAIYEAESRWDADGHDARSFQLVHVGGMRRELSHPGLRTFSPIPTHHAIDDLEELGWIRVEHRDGDNRTFALTMSGREHASGEQGAPASGHLESAGSRTTEQRTARGPDPSRVMVVFGRNAAARNAMFGFLRSLGLGPIEWEQAIAATGAGSPHNSGAVLAAMTSARAIVIILTAEERAGLLPALAGPDDQEELRLAGQPRQNVLLEAGMAYALEPDRTILVELGPVRRASDFAGMNTVRLNNSVNARAALRQRLITAGCAVDLTANDYLHPDSSGDFDRAVVRYIADGEQVQTAAAVSRSRDHLEYFWSSADLSVKYRWWQDGQGWSDANVLDGPKASSLAAVSAGADDELLFGLAPDGRVWYRVWERNDKGWLVAGGPGWIAGTVFGPIAVGRRDHGRLEVMAFDAVGRPCHVCQKDGSWSNWTSDWWRPTT